MAKKYKFDLTVDASALLQANPSEYYSLLYGMENAVTNYRVLPGIKNKTKIATVVFDKVLAESGCDFSAVDGTVSAVEIDVCALTSQASVCQFDLEQSWLALEMAKGSNSDFSVASFMNFFWGQMAKKGHQELAQIMWKGDTLSETATLNLCDGWLKKLCAADDYQTPAGTYAAITASNVLDKMGATLTAATAEMLVNPSNMQFKVSPDVAAAYRIATAANNTTTNVTVGLSLTYLDIPVVVEYGLPTSTIILSDYTNFIYALDAEGDQDNLQIVDFSKTTLDRRIGARADFKAGFYVVNTDQVVWYGGAQYCD
jgi:riboflavin synthase